MPKKSLKTQQDLEKHLRVYIDVLEDKGYEVDACVLKEAIRIIHEHHSAVLPNQCRAKKAVLLSLFVAKGKLLSVDDLMDAMREARLITDRRRLSQRLVDCKRVGEVSNPVRGFWKIEKKGRDYVKKLRAKAKKKRK